MDAAWLKGKGYSSPLLSRYVAQGWLDHPARGIYRRPGGPLLWQHVVISLQTMLQQAVFVGGRTALELHGFAHYLSVDRGPGDAGGRGAGHRSGAVHEVHLYGDGKAPAWLFELPLDTRFVFHNAGRLFPGEPTTASSGSLSWDLKDDGNGNAGPLHGASLTQQPWGHWAWPLTLSSPERAVLEMIDELPKRETFHQVDMLMEGLATLSPRRLSRLLADCRSVKVKRLFLWFADRHRHAWFKRLDLDNVDLGAGKRQIVAGGKFDPTYRITVPRHLDAGI